MNVIQERVRTPGVSLRGENGDARRYLRDHLTRTQDRVAVDGLLLQEVHRVEAIAAAARDSADVARIVQLEERVALLEAAVEKIINLPGIAMQVEGSSHAKSPARSARTKKSKEVR